MVVGFIIKQKQITNFEQCAAAGNPITESYPKQCKIGDKVFLENTITIMEDFKLKVVYTTSSSSANVSLFEQDCEKRGGKFNLCGNVCAPDAESCAQMCAYTCEDIFDKTPLEKTAEEFCQQENVSNVLFCDDFIQISFNNFVGSNRYYLSNGTVIFCSVVVQQHTTKQCKDFAYITENSDKFCKEIC